VSLRGILCCNLQVHSRYSVSYTVKSDNMTITVNTQSGTSILWGE